MSPEELEQVVAMAGEEILARLGPGGSAHSGAVRNIPGLECSDCAGRCVEACAQKTQAVVAAGADRVSAAPSLTCVAPAIASLIDHTLLKPEATRKDIVKLCGEAKQFGFASVCVNPYWVPTAAAELAGAPVKVCTVAGFPLGATPTPVKVAETGLSVKTGAQEIDMVINVGALRGGDYETVKLDVEGVVEAARRGGAIVKVILETALLDDHQKAIACALVKMAGAAFVKTSTGFGPGGATVHDVALMRLVVGPEMGVKAAGGIRTLEDLKSMASAGATRIGASASVKIVEAAC